MIFQNIFKQKILKTAYAIHADKWSKDASAFVQVVKQWSAIGEEGAMKEVVIKAYVESLRFVWFIMCVLAAVALMASIFWTEEISLERELETDQGFIHDRKNKDYNLKSKSPIVDEEQALGSS